MKEDIKEKRRNQCLLVRLTCVWIYVYKFYMQCLLSFLTKGPHIYAKLLSIHFCLFFVQCHWALNVSGLNKRYEKNKKLYSGSVFSIFLFTNIEQKHCRLFLWWLESPSYNHYYMLHVYFSYYLISSTHSSTLLILFVAIRYFKNVF